MTKPDGRVRVDSDQLQAIIRDTRAMVADILQCCTWAENILLLKPGADEGADAVARAERALVTAAEEHARAERALAAAKNFQWRKTGRPAVTSSANLPEVDRLLRKTRRMLLEGSIEKRLRHDRFLLHKKSEYVSLAEGSSPNPFTAPRGRGLSASRGLLRRFDSEMKQRRADRPEADSEDLADEVLRLYSAMSARGPMLPRDPGNRLALSSAWRLESSWLNPAGIAEIRKWLIDLDHHRAGAGDRCSRPDSVSKLAARLLKLKKDTLTEANRLWKGKWSKK